MANPSSAHEPSMEEILASIRQIISEEGDGASDAPADAGVAKKAAEPKARIVEPEPVDDEPEPVEAAAPAEEPEPEPEEEPEPEPVSIASHGEPMKPSIAPAHAPFAEATARQAPASMASSASSAQSSASAEADRNLLSRESDVAVSGAFSALAHTILAQNARTLEDLVAEMLQPMLKEWLDDNLPSLVERLVQEEIQRVSRGRR